MRTTSSTIANAATAFLALTAGVEGAADARHPATDLQPLTGGLPRIPDRSLLSLPPPTLPPPRLPPRHIAGHAIPNLCGTWEPQPVGMVVAHFDENLSWIDARRHNTTIYCKNEHHEHSDAWQDYRAWFDLPNVGLESHTYLYHIVSHWECLDDITIFAQGRVEDSVDNYQGVDELFTRTQANPEGMILYRWPGTFSEWWGVWHFGKWKNELDNGTMRKSERNPGQFWRWMFNGEDPPEKVQWTWSATFAVRRFNIRRRPLRFYVRLLHHFEAVGHKKPEEGHFMERFWVSVFRSDAGLHRRHARRRLELRG